MIQISEEIKLQIFYFLIKDISVSEFEDWFNQNHIKIENQIRFELYYELLSFNYNQKGAYYLLSELLEKLIDKKEFLIWQIKKLLNSIINDEVDTVEAIVRLNYLYFESDEKIIPIHLGIGYSSDIDDIPDSSRLHLFESRFLKNKLQKLELYRQKLKDDAKEFLDELNNA